MFQLVNQTGITGYIVRYNEAEQTVDSRTNNQTFNTTELQFDDESHEGNIYVKVAALSEYGTGAYGDDGPVSVPGMYSLLQNSALFQNVCSIINLRICMIKSKHDLLVVNLFYKNRILKNIK